MTAATRKSFRWSAVPVLTLVLVSPACVYFGSPKVWVEEQRDLEFPSGDVESVRVVTNNGAIHIQASQDPASEGVLVQARVRAGGKNDEDARECLETIVVETSRSGSTQTVQASCGALRKSGWAWSVSYDISLPARLALELESDNGAIDVTGVKGPCRLNTDNGSVALRGGQGSLWAETHNGQVDVETLASSVNLSTHNGSVTATLGNPDSIAGSISTHNGSIRLDLADNVSTQIEVHTNNGRITNELPLHDATVSKSTVKGRLGGGGERLTVRTHNGGITVR